MGRIRTPSARPRRRAAAPAAWLVAAAIALQGTLGLALGLRMAADPLDLAVVELCTDSGAAPGDPADRPAAPAHDHGQCLICQGGLGPLLAAAAPAALVPGPALRPSEPTLDEAPAPPAPPLAYASRAPPPVA